MASILLIRRLSQLFNIAIAIALLCSSQNLVAQLSKKQTTSPLKQLLWKYIEHCANSIEDKEEGETTDNSKNGYMAAYWSGPPCGCGCESEAGAYKTQKGEYVILAVGRWECSWTEEVLSNRPLPLVLPESFGFTEFNRQYQRSPEDTIALFYLHVEIPRKGTVTNVRIKPVPFGLNVKSTSVLATSIGEKFGRPMIVAGDVYNVIDSLSSAAVLTTFLSGEYNALKRRDKRLFESLISTIEGEYHARHLKMYANACVEHTEHLNSIKRSTTIQSYLIGIRVRSVLL